MDWILSAGKQPDGIVSFAVAGQTSAAFVSTVRSAHYMTGVSWEELEKKTNAPKQTKKVCGKLNAPRELFRQRDTGYVRAGNEK